MGILREIKENGVPFTQIVCSLKEKKRRKVTKNYYPVFTPLSMTTIELTTEQAEALARGESITIHPEHLSKSESVVINLTQGFNAVVDLEDAEELLKYSWFIFKNKNNVYTVREEAENGKRKVVRMHRQIMNAPDGLFVDHINHDTLDNRKINLRICSAAENNRNKLPHSKKYKYKGVSETNSGKFAAKVFYNKKIYHLGNFEKIEDAAKAYDKKAKELFGEFAYLNFS